MTLTKEDAQLGGGSVLELVACAGVQGPLGGGWLHHHLIGATVPTKVSEAGAEAVITNPDDFPNVDQRRMSTSSWSHTCQHLHPPQWYVGNVMLLLDANRAVLQDVEYWPTARC